MPTPELVVFDIAGTTIQVADEVPGAFRQAFTIAGIELADEEIVSIRGKAKRQAICGLLQSYGSDADTIAVHRAFREILLNRYRNQPVTAIDGAAQTFAWLRSHQTRIALNTGFDKELARLLIKQVGWEEVIDAVVCDDDVEYGRPAPDMILNAMQRTGCIDTGCVAVVGDTVSDLEAATNAGACWKIGVLSGAHSRAQLKQCAGSTIIDSVKDLPSVFE